MKKIFNALKSFVNFMAIAQEYESRAYIVNSRGSKGIK